MAGLVGAVLLIQHIMLRAAHKRNVRLSIDILNEQEKALDEEIRKAKAKLEEDSKDA